MKKYAFQLCLIIYLAIILPAAQNSFPQNDTDSKNALPPGKAVMWEPVKIEELDLFLGPGGTSMKPNLNKIEFIKEEKSGHNKKFRIKDGSGRIWVVKIGREARPETVSVRLLWAIGYKTEINYFVGKITIPTKGTFENVRLEARPTDVKRLGEWKWRENPFVGSNELAGLKMMMVFMNNWDVLDLQNEILLVTTKNSYELHYVISDLGSTFGKLGSNNIPVIYRLGRTTGNPKDYLKTNFIKGVENGRVEVAYKGKNRDLFEGFSLENALWLSKLLNRLSEPQIKDAFRAAGYSETEIDLFTKGVKNRIAELNSVVHDQKFDQN